MKTRLLIAVLTINFGFLAKYVYQKMRPEPKEISSKIDLENPAEIRHRLFKSSGTIGEISTKKPNLKITDYQFEPGKVYQIAYDRKIKVETNAKAENANQVKGLIRLYPVGWKSEETIIIAEFEFEKLASALIDETTAYELGNLSFKTQNTPEQNEELLKKRTLLIAVNPEGGIKGLYAQDDTLSMGSVKLMNEVLSAGLPLSPRGVEGKSSREETVDGKSKFTMEYHSAPKGKDLIELTSRYVPGQEAKSAMSIQAGQDRKSRALWDLTKECQWSTTGLMRLTCMDLIRCLWIF